jgi:[ribosomal protein S5]-alanine N-acetyltransferase
VTFPDSFSTARLVAERLEARHWDAIREMDSDAAYMALLGGVRDEAATRAYVDRNLKHWDDYGFGLWILRSAEDDRVAGRCVIRHLDVEGTDEVELGYGLHTEYWGQGLATEIAKELLRLGTTVLSLATMVAITTRANVGSQRVLEKTGLVYEREVQHQGEPVMLYRSR